MSSKKEIILIGAGIMSATLAVLLKELEPKWNISVFETLAAPAMESSNAWNNAGTGHAALCELNYTAEDKNGKIDISKALKINEQFMVSRQFWSYLVENKEFLNPSDFITNLPHMSLVTGRKNVEFLRKRHKLLSQHPMFEGMEMSEDPSVLREWFPLIMEGRKNSEILAATRICKGTDVDFGCLTVGMFEYLKKNGVAQFYNHTVKDIKQSRDGSWTLRIKNNISKKAVEHKADFVFVGAGGGSLPLLQKSGIPESKHIGGFPVSGIFLVCNNPEIISRHHGKVYGKAKIGAPPMSVPHLDTRLIKGEKALLFGPFAGFTPKFLKCGKLLDLPSSIKPDNFLTMISAGIKEFSLTRYLIQQVLLSDEKRIVELRDFIPNAKKKDWEAIIAGQRVQVIKDTKECGRGTLQFGTEIITSSDGSIAALLGASPGASTAVSIMLDLMKQCFPDKAEKWKDTLSEMIPSFGTLLSENNELYEKIEKDTAEKLKLN